MKKATYLILTAVTIFFSSFKSSGKKENEKETSRVCLEVLGIALDENERPIDGVEVRLYKENDELEWNEITSVTHHEHSFVFNLDVNEYYTIEISKNGFVSRSVAISTKLPADISLASIFHYEFEISLFKEKKGVDDYYLDFPVALISYDTKRDVFDNNYSYTAHIKTKIKESASVFKSNAAKK